MLFIESRTRQRSEREPADSLKDKLNVIGGWVAALTFALGRFTCFHETTNAKGSRCNGNLPRTVALCVERRSSRPGYSISCDGRMWLAFLRLLPVGSKLIDGNAN